MDLDLHEGMGPWQDLSTVSSSPMSPQTGETLDSTLEHMGFGLGLGLGLGDEGGGSGSGDGAAVVVAAAVGELVGVTGGITSDNVTRIFATTTSSPGTLDQEIPDPVATLSLLLVGIFLSILILVSILGNALVCVAIYTDRGLRKMGNLFLVSLAISDLFVAGLVMTFALVNDLLGYWVFGEQFCDTWIAFDVMCSTASILNLCAISLERYIHIKDPLRYGHWINKRVILGAIACIWLLAGLISFLPISLDLHRPSEPVEIDATSDPQCALDLTPTYAMVSSCISFYLPCAVMVSIYCRLYLYARRHVKNIKAVMRPVSFGTLDGECPGGNAMPANSSYHVSDHKAAITIGVIMGVFLICWVPFFIANIVAAFCKTCIPDMAFKVLTWLGYCNSALNPVIYSIFNTEFRDAFRRILTTRYPICYCCFCGEYQAVGTSARRSYEPEAETGSINNRQVLNGNCNATNGTNGTADPPAIRCNSISADAIAVSSNHLNQMKEGSPAGKQESSSSQQISCV